MQAFFEDFLCGSFGGVASCVSGFFLDTVKVNMQINSDLSMISAITKLCKTNGLSHLFSGIYYPLMTAPFISAFSFGFYELYKNLRGKTQLSYIDGLENGAFAGLIIAFIATPVELVKCQMQTNGQKFGSSRECLKGILKQGGIKGIYKGFFPTLIRQVPSYSLQFATYEFLKVKLVKQDENHLNLLEAMIVGPIAALSSQIFTYPQDVIKTRIQVNPNGTYKRAGLFNDEGVVDCFKSILRKEGWRGFTIGLKPTLLRALLADGVGIVVYEKSQEAMAKFKKN